MRNTVAVGVIKSVMRKDKDGNTTLSPVGADKDLTPSS
jgi:hypothetical protein